MAGVHHRASGETQLTAGHVGLVIVPVVVADGPPITVDVDFQASFARSFAYGGGGAVNQAQLVGVVVDYQHFQRPGQSLVFATAGGVDQLD